MDGQRCGYRFHLHHDDVFDNQIDAVVLVEVNALVNEWYRPLRHITKISVVQLVEQSACVCGFQQARTKDAMDFDGG